MGHTKNKMKEDYEIIFWKDWLEADSIKKFELVKNLPIIKEIQKIDKLPKKYREHIFTSLLNGFFEDLESAVYTKIRLESKKKR